MPAIDLAPRHKLGLALANPVMLAAGVAGYGDALAPGLTMAGLGAWVTAPVTRRPWHGQRPAIVETTGGVVWQRPLWNPGVKRVLRDFTSLWRRSPAPVIVHIADPHPDDLAAVAAELEASDSVAGLEIDLPAQADASLAATLVWAVRESADLPLLVRLPLALPDAVLQAALDAGADALVVAQPPDGLTRDPESGELRLGGFHGPGLAPLIAARLAALARQVPVPLVACGGIHSLEDAQTCLQAGALAVQVDLVAWVDPRLPARLAVALTGEVQA